MENENEMAPSNAEVPTKNSDKSKIAFAIAAVAGLVLLVLAFTKKKTEEKKPKKKVSDRPIVVNVHNNQTPAKARKPKKADEAPASLEDAVVEDEEEETEETEETQE